MNISYHLKEFDPKDVAEQITNEKSYHINLSGSNKSEEIDLDGNFRLASDAWGTSGHFGF